MAGADGEASPKETVPEDGVDWEAITAYIVQNNKDLSQDFSNKLTASSQFLVARLMVAETKLAVAEEAVTGLQAEKVAAAALQQQHTLLLKQMQEQLVRQEAHMQKQEAQLQKLTAQVEKQAKQAQPPGGLEPPDAVITHMQAELRSFRDVLSGVKQSTADLQKTTEEQDRASRACDLIITHLPENMTDSAERMRDTLACLFTDTKARHVHVVKAERLGAKPGPQGAKPRALVVRLSSVQEKVDVLRGRKHLGDSQKFRRVGVNPSLTKLQQQAKANVYEFYIKARHEGIPAWFRDERLFIAGEQFQFPPPPHVGNSQPSGRSSQPTAHVSPSRVLGASGSVA